MDCSKGALARSRHEREQALRRELGRLAALLRTRPDVRLVLLFGSLAEGTCGAHSDLDLVVVLDTDRSFRERTEDLYRWLQPELPTDLLVYTPDEWREVRQRGFLRRAAEVGEVPHEAAA